MLDPLAAAVGIGLVGSVVAGPAVAYGLRFSRNGGVARRNGC